MPKRLEYTTEFKEQAVRFVFDSLEPNESRREACERLGSKMAVKPVTLVQLGEGFDAGVDGSGPGCWVG